MIKYHNFSLTEIENLIPWEKTIYISLIRKQIEEIKLKNNK